MHARPCKQGISITLRVYVYQQVAYGYSNDSELSNMRSFFLLPFVAALAQAADYVVNVGPGLRYNPAVLNINVECLQF